MSLRVVLATINLSIAAVKRRRAQLLAQVVRLMRNCDVVGIQEAGAGRSLVEEAARIAEMIVWFGDGRTGQASTPIAVTRRAKHVRFVAHLLTKHGRYVGPGAGPDHSKAKWLMVALFELDGEEYAVGNLHLSASQHKWLRALVALIQARRAAKFLRRNYPDRHRAILGDTNNVPGARTFRPFRRYLRSTQRRLKPTSTHGRRPIDDVYVDSTLRPESHQALKTASDHDAYRVVLTVKESR